MSVVLAIDTSLAACSVALAWEERGVRRLVHRLRTAPTGHAEALMGLIAEATAEAGVGFADLDRIAVSVGPGTFSGLRIGIAAARGLALASGKPTVGVSSLLVLAATAGLRTEIAAGRLVAATIDARRGEVYLQLARRLVDGWRAESEPLLLPVSEAARRLPIDEPVLAVGYGAPLLGSAGSAAVEARLPDLLPDARGLVQLADTAAPGEVRPLYLRPPDAKPTSGALPLRPA